MWVKYSSNSMDPRDWCVLLILTNVTYTHMCNYSPFGTMRNGSRERSLQMKSHLFQPVDNFARSWLQLPYFFSFTEMIKMCCKSIVGSLPLPPGLSLASRYSTVASVSLCMMSNFDIVPCVSHRVASCCKETVVRQF